MNKIKKTKQKNYLDIKSDSFFIIATNINQVEDKT